MIYVNYTGGLQFAREEGSTGRISPVRRGAQLIRSGNISENEARRILTKCGAIPLQIEKLSTHGSVVSATRVPVVPGEVNHLRSPADYWFNAARNQNPKKLAGAGISSVHRLQQHFDDVPREISAMRRLAVNLRNMDLTISQLISAHSEALFRALEDRTTGAVSYAAVEDAFSTYTLGFFASLGAARDHFADLLASRVGMSNKVDDMTRLLSELDIETVDDPIISLMVADGLIDFSDGTARPSGWLDKLRLLRREYIHKTPYGFRFFENFGTVDEKDQELGIFYYRRNLRADGAQSDDMLLEFGQLYRNASRFFLRAFRVSGYDGTLMTLTEDDVVSLNWKAEGD